MDRKETDRVKSGRAARYILAVAALSLLIVLANIGVYRRYREGLFAQEQKQLLLMAETVGKSLENYINAEIEKIDLCFSERGDSVSADELETLTTFFLKENPHVFRAVAAISEDGGVYFSTFTELPEGIVPRTEHDDARILGKALADTGWYELYVQKALMIDGRRATLLFSLDLHEIYLKIVAPICTLAVIITILPNPTMRKIRAFKRREKCNAIIESNLPGKEADRKQIAAAVPNDHTTQMLALSFMPDNIGGVFADLAKHIGNLLIAGQGEACIAGIGCIENKTA